MNVGHCSLIWIFLALSSMAQGQDAQFQRKLKEAEVYLNRGMAREKANDLVGAAADFSEAIRRDRGSVDAYEHRAQCYFLSGKFTSAIRDLLNAEKIGGKATAWQLHLLADCYMANDQSVEALRCLDRLMSMNSNDTDAHLKRGMLYVKTRNYAQAITEFDWVREQGSVTAKLYLSLAEAYMGMGNRAAAISALDDAAALDPDNANVWFNRGLFHEDVKDYPSAIVDYNQALRLDVTDADALYNRASCKAYLGDFGAAVSDMDEAIRLDPRNAAYYKQRGNFYYRLNQKDKACFDWRKSVEHGDPKARFQLDTYCK